MKNLAGIRSRCWACLAALLLSLAGGCPEEAAPGSQDVVADPGTDPGNTADAVTETEAVDDVFTDDLPQFDPGPPSPPGPPGMAERGLSELRVVIHAHSAYSHDGCDDAGLDEDGQPNQTCIARLRAGLCEERIAVAFMTDHPSHMEDFPFQDVLYGDEAAGDVYELGTDGQPIAAGLACPEGEGGPDGRVWVMAGAESGHSMPIGLERHVDPISNYGIRFKDDATPEELKQLISGIHAAGGMLTLCHTEDDDVSAETIAAWDVTAMEVYNFHANFTTVLEDNLMTKVFDLEGFLATGDDAPHPDLVALLLLSTYPEAQLLKWRRASALKPITGFAAADVHENVILPAVCQRLDCSGLRVDYPNLTEFLEVGGNLNLSDGERIDGYGRIFRWVQNRLWVEPGQHPIHSTREAIRAGRNMVVFEILGEARGAELLASLGEGDQQQLFDMGDSVALADGPTLWARSPDWPSPPRTANWSSPVGAVMTSTVYRSTPEGTEPVATWNQAGWWHEIPLDTPGAYYLEVTLQPGHLAADLGSMAAMADETYRWVITNAVYVTAEP